MVENSISRRIFLAVNIILFVLIAAICLFPIIQVLAISLSSSTAVEAGKVMLLPVDFTLTSYKYVLEKSEFWRAFGISIARVLIGVPVSMILTIFAGYVLSKDKKDFPAKNVIVWLFIFTMLFSGGMIPTYMVVRYTGLLNKMGALILPCAVQVFNIILMMNFFKGIPKEMEEAAFMDGAGHFRTLFQIYIPLSMAAIATLIVFTVVSHWNSWFDGMIYMTEAKNYPMQTYLQAILVKPNIKVMTKTQAQLLSKISNRTLTDAQVFIAAIPVLLVYPFLQKHFVTGVSLGGVKE